MGKNRTNTNTGQSKRELVYFTAGGKKIYDNSYTREFYRSFQWDVAKWVDFQNGKTPDENMTPEELDYIFSHMETVSAQMTRVEPRTRNFSIYDENNKFVRELQEGDTFNFNGQLKSFSRGMDATNEYINRNYEGKDLVIYRTPKGLPSFNVTEWDNNYEWEKESWINSKDWHVDKITDVSEDYPSEYRVRIVDISPET